MKPNNNLRFIPPKYDDHDWNPEIEQFIQDELDRFPEETDIRDEYDEEDPDDLKDVL